MVIRYGNRNSVATGMCVGLRPYIETTVNNIRRHGRRLRARAVAPIDGGGEIRCDRQRVTVHEVSGNWRCTDALCGGEQVGGQRDGR